MHIMAQRNIYQLVTTISLFVNLFGCTYRANLLQEQPTLAPTAITHWKIDGKISGFTKNSGWRSSIIWIQEGHNFTVKLLPTLTSRKILLRQTAKEALFETTEEKLTGKILDKLLYNKIGWYIPFKSMQYWLKGLPDPNSKYKITSGNNANKKIIQDNWEIEYKSFVSSSKYKLPKKIFISNKTYNLRLIINNWNFTPPPLQSKKISNNY